MYKDYVFFINFSLMNRLYFSLIFFGLNFYIVNAKNAELENGVKKEINHFDFFKKNVGDFKKFAGKGGGVSAVNVSILAQAFAGFSFKNNAQKSDLQKKGMFAREKLKDKKFASQLNLIYDHLSPEERKNFGNEVLDNIEVYDNLLGSDLSQGELVQLYKFLYAFGKDDKNKNLSKNIFKGKCFKFILRTCGVNGLKQLSEFFRCIVDEYNKLPLELRQILEKISEQIENNMKKNGLDAFFRLLMSDIEAIRGNILSNEHVKNIIKEIQTIMSMKQINITEEKEVLVKNSKDFIKSNFDQYKKNFFTAKNMFNCQKTMAGIRNKVNICLDSCRKPGEQNRN